MQALRRYKGRLGKPHNATRKGHSRLPLFVLLVFIALPTFAHEVDLSWNAPVSSPDPVVGYNIYRATGSGALAVIGSTSNVAYVDSTVSGGTTYSYEVKSVDASGVESVPSSEVTLAVPSAPPPPNTWYVNAAGGNRYEPTDQPTGQCDGLSPAPYPGTGTNQHCAFNDVRYLWTDGTYTTDVNVGAPKWGWIGAGGDTYLISNGPWRVGQNGPNSGDSFGLNGDPFATGAPSPPSGTAGAHTKILGEHFASCGSQSAMTQLYGGFGVFQVLSLGSAYVDVECIELTRHSQCIKYGSPALPSGCNTSFPLDDYANNGIGTSTGTHDVLLQDMWIHGFTSRGIIGPIGGTITATRVQIAINGETGWDFDDGTGNNTPGDPHQFGTPSVNGVLAATNLLIEWSGCNQAYPGGTVLNCYSQSTGGQGDGIGTPAGTCVSQQVTNSIFRYNTQEGYDFLHNDTGTCPSSVTHSISYGNSGQAFKWGPANNPMTFTNNVAVGNCLRLSAPFTGLPSNYDTNLQDFCRASDTLTFGVVRGGTATIDHNTIIGYSPTLIDPKCGPLGCDSTSTVTLSNNIVLGYDNPATYATLGGQAGGPGAIYTSDYAGTVVRSNNVYFGVGHGFTPAATEQVVNPAFVGQPASFTTEAALDVFNTVPQLPNGSAIAGLGAQGAAVTLASIAVTPNPGAVNASSTLAMTCTATFSDSSTAACRSPVWTDTAAHTSINSSTGVVTGVSAGSDTVTATIGSVSGNATVNVSAPATNPGVTLGGTIKFSGTVKIP